MPGAVWSGKDPPAAPGQCASGRSRGSGWTRSPSRATSVRRRSSLSPRCSSRTLVVTIENAGLNPTRTGLLAVLEAHGRRDRRRARRGAGPRAGRADHCPHLSSRWPPTWRPTRSPTLSTNCPCSCSRRPRRKAFHDCEGRRNFEPRRATVCGPWSRLLQSPGCRGRGASGRDGCRRRPERLGGRKHPDRGGPSGGDGRGDRGSGFEGRDADRRRRLHRCLLSWLRARSRGIWRSDDHRHRRACGVR